MSAPSSANKLPNQTPNTSAPIGEAKLILSGSGASDETGTLQDSLGGIVTGSVRLSVRVTQAWRYLFGTFVQRSKSVNPTFSLTAGVGYSQSQMQALIAQVEALSKAVGSQ